MKIVRHAPYDDLEAYVLRKLPEAEAAPLEEHLLVCEECRERLESTDAYVAAVRAAAEKIRTRADQTTER